MPAIAAGVNLAKLGYQSDYVVAGKYDIMLAACFRSRRELGNFLTAVLPNVPGVLRAEPSYVLSAPQRTCDWLGEIREPSVLDIGCQDGPQRPVGELMARRKRAVAD